MPRDHGNVGHSDLICDRDQRSNVFAQLIQC
jgi:hypothetical protein